MRAPCKLSCHPTRLGPRKGCAILNRAARSPPGRDALNGWVLDVVVAVAVIALPRVAMFST